MSNSPDERIQKKLDDLLAEMTGHTEGLVKTAHYSSPSSRNISYKSSFLTMGDTEIPDDYREIFRWCRYFFKFDSLVGPAIRKLATFPVTEYVVNDSKDGEKATEDNEDSVTFKFYNGMLSDLNLYKHLMEIGYNYFLYANVIIFAQPGVEVVKYRNPENPEEILERKEVTWKSVKILDPSLITKDRDPKTNEMQYYYHIPPDIKRIVKRKKPKAKYDSLPKIYKEAVKKNVPLKLNSKYVYELSMPTEAGDNGLWSTPPILHAMKLIMYTNVLRQAQEAIAREHIVPKRIYYFEPTSDTQEIDQFERISQDFAVQLNRQLRDPNFQIISPFPINEINHGGQGRNLLLVPEIEQLQNSILAALNVPKEFVFGGMSYSGSATSLRILENDFITYRSLLSEYVNEFLIKRLAEIRGEWLVPEDDDKLIRVEFSELKMQDDIQQKEMMVRLNQAGKLPDEILYEKVFGLHSDTVKEQLANEQREEMKTQFELQKMQQQMMEQMGMDPSQMEGEEGPEGEQQEGQPEQQEEQQEGQPEQQNQSEQEEQQGNQSDVVPLTGDIPIEYYTSPNSLNPQGAMMLAEKLFNKSPDEVEPILKQLSYESAVEVRTYMNLYKDQQEMQTDMRPAPEKLPPRRQGGA